MRYALNDLLEEEDVAKLTGEVFVPHGKRGLAWRRVAALAACVALAVGVVHFQAIAAEAQRLYQYIAGVGAVKAESHILVQGEPIVWELDGETYTLSGATELDGVVSFTVLLSTEKVLTGEAWFDIVLLENGEPCRTVWGNDAERIITPYQTEENWVEQEEPWGYLVPERYRGGGSFAGTSPSFYTDGSGSYTVELWYNSPADQRPARVGEPLTAELKLQTPESQSFREHTRPQDGGTLTALVRENGRRVSFYLDGAEDGLSLRAPYDLWFVDEAGGRYRGVLESGPANLPVQGVEVSLETEPDAPIVSLEVGSLLLCKYDAEDNFLGYEYRSDLNWTISLD